MSGRREIRSGPFGRSRVWGRAVVIEPGVGGWPRWGTA
jgi:hypothetical protein